MRYAARVTILSLFCLTIGGTGLHGQDKALMEWKYTGEIVGSIGHGRFYHGDDHLGNGLDWGVGFGVRPFSGRLRGLGFEVMVNGLKFKNAWGGDYTYEYKGDMRVITGNALYHFGRSRAQFYLVGGIGALWADYTYRNGYMNTIINDPDYVATLGATKMAINFGAGVKARIVSGLAIRPEIRFYDTTIGTGYNWTHMRLSIGVAWHF